MTYTFYLSSFIQKNENHKLISKNINNGIIIINKLNISGGVIKDKKIKKIK